VLFQQTRVNATPAHFLPSAPQEAQQYRNVESAVTTFLVHHGIASEA
jgi:hypothetical protein